MDETKETFLNHEIDADYSTDGENNDPDALIPSLEARIEGLLFVSTAPVGVTHLMNTLETSKGKVETALKALEQHYHRRGIKLQKTGSGYQLISTPDIAHDIERFFELESTTNLSRAALEVLSIVAYLQPVTRPKIDSIRGVNSDSSLRTLLRHGLIEELGRSEGPGRPILYGTSPDFLQHFGLTSLDRLPAIDLELLESVEDADGDAATASDTDAGQQEG